MKYAQHFGVVKEKSKLRFAVPLLIVSLLLAVGAFSFAQAASPFFNGFETDTSNWNDFGGGVITRVASGTDGIPSSDGSYHANITGPVYTDWGGYESVFPTNGYISKIDVYLDMSLADGSDLRFDFSSAINKPDGDHRRDFIFHLGTNPGTPGQWAASASNNAPGWPLNPGRDPIDITSTGWYTLRHTFQDDGTGVLEVVMELLDSSENVLGTWTLSDPLDVIGSTVGGNRYGWFTSQRFDFEDLAIDNSMLNAVEVIEPCAVGPGFAAFTGDYTQGTRKDGSAVDASRSDLENATGSPDGSFFSFGVDGQAVVEFNGYVTNEDGVDLSFHEVTNGRSSYPEEVLEVEVSQNGSDWYAIGSVTNKDGGDGVGYLDFDITGLDWIRYVRMSDATNFGLHSNNADGYDIDAVDATYIECDEPEQREKAKVVAHKIVCEYEEDLPNWGSGGPNITEGFAETWVDEHEDCWLAEDWDFQWTYDGDYPGGDYYGEVDNWYTFGPTDEDGMTMTWVDVSNQPSRIEMREVLQDGYLPFSDSNSNQESAEFYCHTDVKNYDNWDWIRNPEAWETYYCIAWNVEEVPDVNVLASKVICNAEEHLPNWGGGSSNINATTAQNHVDNSNGNCWLDPDWDFQWAPPTSNPGDNVYEAGDPWTTFNGSVSIPAEELENVDRIWVREVFKENYVEFTGANKIEDVSAELYCHTDVLNYDNYDFIGNPEPGADYYCVGFNVLKPAVLSATKIECTIEGVLPNWGDGSGGPGLITSTTADDWLAEDDHAEYCEKVDWEFQWVSDAEDDSNPGDQTEEAAAPWQTFADYTDVDIATLGDDQRIWIREVFNEDYIPFGGQNTQDDESAEIYCHTDILNFDNWEFITGVEPGEEYHCVAWNVHVDAGMIQGRKYHDVNANGDFDQEEKDADGNVNRLDGWTINLYDDEWNLLKTMETGDDGTEAGSVGRGQYRFVGLGVGTYYVCEVQQGGWVQTEPASGPQPEDDSPYCFETEIDHPTRERTGLQFGNYEAVGQIQGLVYNDENNDGSQGVSEPELENWEVLLLTRNSPHTVVGQFTTGPTGAFAFNNLAYGTYYVCQNIQSGWLQTQLAAIGSGLDADGLVVGDVIPDPSNDLDALVDQFCYAVILDPDNPESLENVFGNFQTVATNGSGVLGATTGTTTGVVLAATDTLSATGEPTYLYLLIGAGVILLPATLAVAVRKHKSRYNRQD